MGCDFSFGDDYEKCGILIDEYQYLLEIEEDIKISDKKMEKHIKEKQDVKIKIKNLLEYINGKADSLAQIDKLQRLNESYQNLLYEESKMNYNDSLKI